MKKLKLNQLKVKSFPTKELKGGGFTTPEVTYNIAPDKNNGCVQACTFSPSGCNPQA